jgi:hypothetical protein
MTAIKRRIGFRFIIAARKILKSLESINGKGADYFK